MTSLAEIATRPGPAGATPVTNQSIADLMLETDQRRRELLRRGEYTAAAILQTEIDLLASALS